MFVFLQMRMKKMKRKNQIHGYKLDKNFKNLANELAQDKSAFKDKISAFENKMALSEKKIEA